MNNNEIMAKIKEIIAEHLGEEEENIQPTSAIADDLGADSLDFVEMSIACEETFDVKIETEDLGDIRTVQDMVDFIAKRID